VFAQAATVGNPWEDEMPARRRRINWLIQAAFVALQAVSRAAAADKKRQCRLTAGSGFTKL
jgi:hypothetical protein